MIEESNLFIFFKVLFLSCLFGINYQALKDLYETKDTNVFKKPVIITKGSNDLITLYTKWGESLDKNKILQEYPRPQFVRDSYLNLNGEWDYSLKNGTEKPEYKEKIIVPFSIESPLSGVKGKSLLPGMTLWYKKIVDLTKIKNQGRFLLHFGAVDQYTKVFINGKKVGDHDGGYTPFYFDITDFLNNDLAHTKIVVRVEDNYSENGAAIGKQGNPRKGIFYVRTGGIWQTVWIESVPRVYIKDVRIVPRYDESCVTFIMLIDGDIRKRTKGNIVILDKEGNYINSSKVNPHEWQNISIPKNFTSWSPENPYLYKLEYSYQEDCVKSYFGMRKFSIGRDKNKTSRLFLNNKPYFQKGVLDQGYWSDGYYTAPSDEAIIYDIKTMKELGFNMLRKHVKIEPKRWYYHCDTIGMIVWQDLPSGGNFPYNRTDEATFIPDDDYEMYSRKSELGRSNFMRDLFMTMAELYNVPSLSTWVPFNEGWGQFDSVKIANTIKDADKTRYVDHASGWVDHNGPDFKSLHIYYEKIKINPDELKRPVVLSEYGGYGCIIKNHVGCETQFSYLMFKKRKITNAIIRLIKKQICPSIQDGLSASVYTQLSDVEGEVNGLLTYDRKVLKVNKNLIRRVNNMIVFNK